MILVYFAKLGWELSALSMNEMVCATLRIIVVIFSFLLTLLRRSCSLSGFACHYSLPWREEMCCM